MMGGEGAFGVLTHVPLKVFRHMPATVKRFSYMFRDWETAQAAAREIMQSDLNNNTDLNIASKETCFTKAAEYARKFIN